MNHAVVGLVPDTLRRQAVAERRILEVLSDDPAALATSHVRAVANLQNVEKSNSSKIPA